MTKYAGNYIYAGALDSETLQFFSQPEGYVTPDGMGGYDYVYQYKDHLGNIRLSYVDNGGTLEIVEENNYYPFGLKHKGYNDNGISPLGNDVAQKWKFGGKEYEDGLNESIATYDFGARNYDPALGRWGNVDNKAETYYSLTPYNYTGNTPVNAIDIDGNLFIFVNGFMLDHWLAGKQSKRIFNPYVGGYINNPDYVPYNPNRGFFKDGPRNNNTTFSYWNGVDDLYKGAYKDDNAYYTSGSSTPKSTANARYNEGRKAAKDLIKKLDKGEIELKEGETIKIVGHSHGAAYAAGLTSVLLKNSNYGGLIEFTDYIAAMQPDGFKHPDGVLGRQWLTLSDYISGYSMLHMFGIIGDTENGRIEGVRPEDSHWRAYYSGGRGGHSVDTYLNMLADYFTSLGINVTVQE